MGERSGIAWTDSTFNPWLGCERVSPGCDFCYAETGSKRFAAQHGLKLWEGDRHVTGDTYWREPLKWHRQAAATGQPWRVFCGSWCDWAEDHPVAQAKRPRLFELIDRTPHLTWMLLTKRPENIKRFVPTSWLTFPRRNVWFGTTCEDQARLDLRAPFILEVPAVAHFFSCEPQLELVTLGPHRPEWVICGGESGPHARPFQVEWAKALRDECAEHGIAFFMKQYGDKPWWNHVPLIYGIDGSHLAHHGADPMQWTPALRVQEFPR